MFLPFVKKMIKKHPNSSLITFSKTGHVVNIDQPDKFNDTSLYFLLENKDFE